MGKGGGRVDLVTLMGQKCGVGADRGPSRLKVSGYWVPRPHRTSKAPLTPRRPRPYSYLQVGRPGSGVAEVWPVAGLNHSFRSSPLQDLRHVRPRADCGPPATPAGVTQCVLFAVFKKKYFFSHPGAGNGEPLSPNNLTKPKLVQISPVFQSGAGKHGPGLGFIQDWGGTNCNVPKYVCTALGSIKILKRLEIMALFKGLSKNLSAQDTLAMFGWGQTDCVKSLNPTLPPITVHNADLYYISFEVNSAWKLQFLCVCLSVPNAVIVNYGQTIIVFVFFIKFYVLLWF